MTNGSPFFLGVLASLLTPTWVWSDVPISLCEQQLAQHERALFAATSPEAHFEPFLPRSHQISNGRIIVKPSELELTDEEIVEQLKVFPSHLHSFFNFGAPTLQDIQSVLALPNEVFGDRIDQIEESHELLSDFYKTAVDRGMAFATSPREILDLLFFPVAKSMENVRLALFYRHFPTLVQRDPHLFEMRSRMGLLMRLALGLIPKDDAFGDVFSVTPIGGFLADPRIIEFEYGIQEAFRILDRAHHQAMDSGKPVNPSLRIFVSYLAAHSSRTTIPTFGRDPRVLDEIIQTADPSYYFRSHQTGGLIRGPSDDSSTRAISSQLVVLEYVRAPLPILDLALWEGWSFDILPKEGGYEVRATNPRKTYELDIPPQFTLPNGLKVVGEKLAATYFPKESRDRNLLRPNSAGIRRFVQEHRAIHIGVTEGRIAATLHKTSLIVRASNLSGLDRKLYFAAARNGALLPHYPFLETTLENGFRIAVEIQEDPSHSASEIPNDMRRLYRWIVRGPQGDSEEVVIESTSRQQIIRLLANNLGFSLGSDLFPSRFLAWMDVVPLPSKHMITHRHDGTFEIAIEPMTGSDLMPHERATSPKGVEELFQEYYFRNLPGSLFRQEFK